MLTKFITVLLLIGLAFDSLLCQQCDVVIANHADYKKEIRTEVDNALNNFMLHNNASSLIADQLSEGNARAIKDIVSEEVSILREEIKQQVSNLQKEMKLLLRPGHTPSHPADSCADILDYNNQSSSGYYWVQNSQGGSHRVYCDMTRTCGGVTGGWMKVVELDMTDISNQCPSTLRQRIDSNKRTCAINSDSASCSPVIYSIDDIKYSKVCGKIKAYQFGTPGALRNTLGIDSNYVDGISLTHGRPREHIWTFVASLHEVGTYPSYNCPCINQAGTSSPPAFVGNDYFCDTGSHDPYQFIFFGDDPLWDGAGCGPLNTCCTLNNPPWFYMELPEPTTDDIEMRVCSDQGRVNEDIAIEKIDIYVL